MHEVDVLDLLPIEAGAFYVMDRGYLGFAGCTSCIGSARFSSRLARAT
jgi:hypothetical protein